MPRPLAGPARGVLHAAAAPDGTVVHQRVVPAADLAEHVAHLWWVRWDLRRPFVAETLPHPSVHLLFERGRATVAGVQRGRFVRRLVGRGQVIGVKFRPGGFAPLLGRSLATLTDRTVAASTVLGRRVTSVARAIGALSIEDALAAIEGAMREGIPPLPPAARALRDLVERLAVDPRVVRVEQVAALAELDVRTLQRRFRHTIGVTPKWVLQRYRLHEAAERLRGPRPPTLAALAGELGYADQAHFVRDFGATIGRPPGAFAAAVRAQAGPRIAR